MVYLEQPMVYLEQLIFSGARTIALFPRAPFPIAMAREWSLAGPVWAIRTDVGAPGHVRAHAVEQRVCGHRSVGYSVWLRAASYTVGV